MISQLDAATLAATTEYTVAPGKSFTVNLGAYATLEFWNGAAWKEYPSVTGSSQDKDFVFVSPPGGLIRVVIVAEQTAIAGFYPVKQ